MLSSQKLFQYWAMVLYISSQLQLQIFCERRPVSYHSKPPDHILPEDRIYNWQLYQNEMEPRTSLLCPKGLFLSRIMYKVYTNQGKDGDSENKHADITEKDENVHIIHIRNHIEALFKERLTGLLQESLESGGIKELVGDNICDVGQVVSNRNFICRNITNLSDSYLDCDAYKIMVLSFMQRVCPKSRDTDTTTTTTLYDKLSKYHTEEMDKNRPAENMTFKNIFNDESQVWAGNRHPLGPCPTLMYCLGHQACLFHYNNKFCQNDAFPGARKHIKVRFSCYDDVHRDNIKSEIVNFLYDRLGVNVNEDLGSLEMYHINVLTEPITTLSSKTVFLKYRAKVKQLIPPEKHLIDEDEVFEVGCPPVESALESGYSGICNPIDVKRHEDANTLWVTLARTATSECREELTQMFCAFRYNTRGQCFPPFVQNNSKVEHNSTNEVMSWSFKAFPENGPRFSNEHYNKIFQNPLMNLIPSRLAFNILAHNSPDIILELLSQLYRPEHYFVIVMDVSAEESRQNLIRSISEVYPDNDNIRVLPAERSFASSWGSFNIVRAELEGYEELLRMGVWDFTINLSGTCLIMRSVDDLAISLAPYRGISFLRTFDMGHSLNLQNFDRILKTWHSCDKHVYNTLLHRGPPAGDLGIFSQNNFQILSRELADFMVSRKSQSQTLQWMHFYQMSTFVSDEMYFRTMLMNSPLRKKNLEVRFYHMKRFQGDNDEFLCRHSEEVDACGQGPGTFGMEDMNELLKESKQFFLARKFSTDTEEPTRKTLLKYQRDDGYYQRHRTQFPPVIEKALLADAVEKLRTSNQITDAVKDMQVSHVQIVPLHKTSDPCCQAIIRHFVQFSQQFHIIIHFKLTLQNDTVTSAVASVTLNPDYLSQCYPEGHIRALQVGINFMPNRGSKSDDILPVQPFSVVQSADTQYIHLRFLLERSSQGLAETQCAETKHVQNPYHMVYTEWDLPDSLHERNRHQPRNSLFSRRPAQPKHHVIPFQVVLYDPKGNVNMTEMRKVERKSFGDRDKGRNEMINVTDVTIALKSGQLDPGEWNIHITEIDQENAFVYKQRIVVLDGNFSSILSKGDKCGLYCVKEVALKSNLQSDKYYVNVPVDSKETETPETSSQTSVREEYQLERTSSSSYEYTKIILDLLITILAASVILRR